MQAPQRHGGSGRPRDTHLDTALLNATLAVLGEVGYSRLTLEQVARRAGTTKPSIYRRWPTRQHLVLAALARQLGDVTVPDTGCTLCDLGEGLSVFVAAFGRMPPDVLGSLLADCAGRPELRAELLNTLFEPPRCAVGHMLRSARDRGDLRDDVDLDLAVDLLGSLVHYRILFGHAPVTERDIETAVETLLQGIATDYPALLAHAREAGGDSPTHPLHT
ncbi:TetR/AcrR family transcriptional regulator [Saccharomonospora piscinae]|uniref:TetR/AcrR family transcriptional regulator n=1 Tax=Saccharomonospora piscinae TaxID=687388 RepID=UPI00110586EA|nr:TetR/AcrR family transcriptional regulator [Saccharomonospora piscinae]TLW94340.1 TetR/AcrR family transcriptional regulator [Saccharomonospora piscinae]